MKRGKKWEEERKIHFKDFHYCLDSTKGKEAFEVEDEKQGDKWSSNRKGGQGDGRRGSPL